MKRYFSGKTVLITGASSGIGKDLALYLASFGCRLILVARRAEPMQELALECERRGSPARVFEADVTRPEDMNRVHSECGDVDIVIANAGVGGINPAYAFSAELHRAMVDVNIFGLTNTLTPFIPGMIRRRSGHLVCVSSLASFRGLPAAASYSSTKAAQRILMESFRLDLKPHGIRVTCICPGFVRTPMTDHSEFDMPFMVSPETSSSCIARAIADHKTLYLYPWPMRWLTLLNRLLPDAWYDRLLPRLSGQKRELKPKMFGG